MVRVKGVFVAVFVLLFITLFVIFQIHFMNVLWQNYVRYLSLTNKLISKEKPSSHAKKIEFQIPRYDNNSEQYLKAEVKLANVYQNKNTIAVCTLARSKAKWTTFKDSDLYRFFLKSTYQTTQPAIEGFDIMLHVGINSDDYFFVHRIAEAIRIVAEEFGMNLTFHNFDVFEVDTIPMNSLMQNAANTGAQYLVRLNDDTEITTKGWIKHAVKELQSFSPSNIGVVGPICREGNTAILTHDMVHRKHLDIFGFYYPKILKNWYIDDWISSVYGPKRTSKLKDWVVIHHIEGGTRYKPAISQHKLLKPLVQEGKEKINHFLNTIMENNVISYSLYGKNPRYTDGAIENAKIYKKIYPGWTMRVYFDSSVPTQTIDILKKNNVELFNMSRSKINKMSWRFSISYNVTRFCSRDIDSRLSIREKLAVDEWIHSGKKFHVMRDHPSHSNYAMSGGMWCATTEGILEVQKIQHSLPRGDNYLKDMTWLNKYLWPIAKMDVLQHDSFSCNKFGGGFPFPSKRIDWEHVGSVYIGGKLRETDVHLLKNAKIPEACSQNHALHALGDLDYITNKRYDAMCDIAYQTRSRNDLKLPIKPYSVICTRGTKHTLASFFALDIQVPFILVTIESDEDITYENSWLKNRFIKQWFSWNSVHHSIIPIPIGLNHDTQFNAIRESHMHIEKVEKLLINFKLDRKERRDMHDFFRHKSFTHVEKYEQFAHSKDNLKRHYKVISRFRWTLCPRGEGHDTHRVWEALYLGSTPVVLKGPLYDLYNEFAIIQIESWKNLTLDKLKEMQLLVDSKQTTPKLKFSYWVKLIRNFKEQAVNNSQANIFRVRHSVKFGNRKY